VHTSVCRGKVASQGPRLAAARLAAGHAAKPRPCKPAALRGDEAVEAKPRAAKPRII